MRRFLQEEAMELVNSGMSNDEVQAITGVSLERLKKWKAQEKAGEDKPVCHETGCEWLKPCHANLGTCFWAECLKGKAENEPENIPEAPGAAKKQNRAASQNGITALRLP